MKSNNELVEHLIGTGVLKTLDIIRAFSKVDRKDFMDSRFKGRAYDDSAFPIGYGQTISQPTTVAFSLELLKPKEGQKIFEIGFGSGYQTAILSKIVGSEGKIYTTEIVPQLRKFGTENVKKTGAKNVEFLDIDGSKGYKEAAPYDRIIAACASEEIPQTLKEQLSEKGRLVLPIGKFVQSIVLVKRKDSAFSRREYPGFMFVNMRSKKN